MSDVNKSVEITLRANLKQLESSLKDIPNMTKKEAKAMTRALSSEFNKAQKAASRAAEESKKAAKATSKSYKDTANSVGVSMDKMASDAKVSAHEVKISFMEAEESTSDLSKNADNVSVALGGTTAVIQSLLPGLYQSAEGALNLANTLGGVAAQAAAGGPVTMKLTAALVVASAAYDLYTRSTRLAAEQQKRMAKAQKEANDKLTEQANIASGIVTEFNTLNLEYKLLTGQINQVEYDLAAAREISLEKEKRELTLQQKRIAEQERLLKIFDKAQKSLSSLTDQEKELLNTSMALSADKEIQKGLDMSAVSAAMNMSRFRKELVQRLQKEKDFSNAIANRRQETLNFEEKIIKAKAEYTAEQQKEEARLEKLAALDAKRLENQARLQEIQAIGQSLSDKRITAEDRARQIFISTLEPQQQIIEQTKERVRQNDLLQEQIMQEIEGADALAKTDKDRAAAAEVRAEGEQTIRALVAERHAIEVEGEHKLQELKDENINKTKENIKSESELRKEKIQKDIETLNLMQQGIVGTFANTIQTMTTIAEAAGNKNKAIIKALFFAQRTAAVGEVGFNTAKAITAAQAYPPPFNGLMIASAVAAGAAQMASIFAQKAPTFHMGGMTPDESIAVVKAGEAVLDRSTVDRLGGEQGVNRLQNGQGGSAEVIVMNPYKHFDRYITDRQRAGLSARTARRGY